jgi:hypothetical protein
MGDITFFFNSNQISIYDLTCIVLFCFVFKVALSPFYRLVNAFEFILVAEKTQRIRSNGKKCHFGFKQLS